MNFHYPTILPAKVCFLFNLLFFTQIFTHLLYNHSILFFIDYRGLPIFIIIDFLNNFFGLDYRLALFWLISKHAVNTLINPHALK